MKAKIYNLKAWVTETDPDKLKEMLTNLLKTSDFTVLGFNDYHFKPYGYSALWLISESHLEVHTWPEEHKSYIELSSCNRVKQEKFAKDLHDVFVSATMTAAGY